MKEVIFGNKNTIDIEDIDFGEYFVALTPGPLVSILHSNSHDIAFMDYENLQVETDFF